MSELQLNVSWELQPNLNEVCLCVYAQDLLPIADLVAEGDEEALEKLVEKYKMVEGTDYVSRSKTFRKNSVVFMPAAKAILASSGKKPAKSLIAQLTGLEQMLNVMDKDKEILDLVFKVTNVESKVERKQMMYDSLLEACIDNQHRALTSSALAGRFLSMTFFERLIFLFMPQKVYDAAMGALHAVFKP